MYFDVMSAVLHIGMAAAPLPEHSNQHVNTHQPGYTTASDELASSVRTFEGCFQPPTIRPTRQMRV